ncbi:MAG: KEOPS complex N(6)-L-threonylcarbamoyladenine synthase Kae1 [Candidatus Aenigmatarchaeota archaeon]
MICLGIESTAHTFSIGIIDDEKILANTRDMYVPEKGGINPLDAKEHHVKVKDKVLEESLATAGLSLTDIDLFAYAAGPGLPPCLKVGAQFAKEISKNKPLFAVNHGVAHIEIGKLMCGCKDPIAVYVSGGNTQVIGYASGRYRVFGETQDIPIGNAIDVFIRETYGKDKKAETFGGPVMEKLAEGGCYMELPYVVKGMDLSFTGITTAAIQKYNKDKSEQMLRNLCFSFQETCYAMLTEVTERALAHTGKSEVLLVGGVAASKRFREMIEIMCQERGAKAFVVPKEYSGDQGVMIAWTGLLMHRSGVKPVSKQTHGVRHTIVDYNSMWRTDQAEITWME